MLTTEDHLRGIEKLAPTELLYYRALSEVLDTGHTCDRETMAELLRMRHLEDYETVLKVSESGFQLMNFLKFKMSGDKPQFLKEA